MIVLTKYQIILLLIHIIINYKIKSAKTYTIYLSIYTSNPSINTLYSTITCIYTYILRSLIKIQPNPNNVLF